MIFNYRLMKNIAFLLMTAILFQSCSNSTTPASKAKDDNDLFLSFTKVDSANPVLSPDTLLSFYCPVLKKNIHWEAKDVFNPAAIVRNDTVFLLYRAEDSIGNFAGTSRIDGLHFKKNSVPVLYPDNDAEKIFEWEGGCEDPRIVQDANGVYYLTYTGYDGVAARLLVATSTDLYHWKKEGHAFASTHNAKFINQWSKSGSIICSFHNGDRPIAEKIGGKYWMYWGDTNIFLASSEDLVHWTPVIDANGKLLIVFGPRPKHFDSDLVEPGPPAMLTKDGILLLYNSRNVPAKGDTSLAEGTYAASQILFDKNNPAKILKRMDNWFMKPEKPYEINGQVNRVCFVEGLVHFKGKWFLYYGTADSKIAVAVH
jgi:predicted GH43/DUF377 family glycosyl hydrolase